MTTQTTNTPSKNRKATNTSMTLRLSRGRTLKITFRPRIRVSPLLVKLLALASGIFAFGAGIAHAAPPVNALPTGGQVVSGVSTIQQAGSALNINQASQKTIINWQSFDIGSQAAVNFYQPNASAIALNRIVGNNASQIYGKLNANGQVFLLNPYGTLFAPGAQVNVGGLLSSTMQMNDADFLAGNYQLSNPGLGIIDNQSIINANSIAFAGNDINNSGSLIATNVSLVAGNTVAVDISGDGLIRARVENPALQAHITNSGMIDAVHQVTMSAGQAKDTLNNVVNNSGIIRATGLSNEGGVITLQGGTTLNSGSLDASSATGKGGMVAMLGEHVGVTGFGSINASGATSGGTILVGGDFQGKNANVQNASRTYFGADASLKADAITSGDGGKVIVWADEVTRGYGNISARGGSASGNGGFVEVSGKHNLDFQAQVDTRAQNGKIGTLLLDPNNIIIDVSGSNTLDDADDFADLGSIVTISNNLIDNATSSVILQANFNINFNASINMSALGAGLTAKAGQIINLDNSITTNGGIVDLTAGAIAGSFGVLKVNADINTGGANVLLTNVHPGGGAAGGLQLNGNINAGAGTVYIENTGDAIVQNSANSIVANNLSVQSSTNVSLLGTNSIANNIAADITGAGATFTYKGSSINIGSVDAIDGITTNAGDIDIFSTLNPINISKDLNGKNVTLGTFDGGINLNSANITASGNVLINSGLDFANSTGLGAGITTINGTITQTGATTSTLNINADTNIIIAAGSQITATNGPSNMTLKSGANGALVGSIALNGTSSGGGDVTIESNGGNITLTGGSGFSSTSVGSGILLNNAILNAKASSSVGGNITLNGATSYTTASAAGVSMVESKLKTGGTGTINVSGKATAASTGTRGALISDSEFESEDGNIIIDGDASFATSSTANSDGILINAGSLIVSNGSGNINITGKSAFGGVAQAGIAIADSPTEIDVHGTGTITLDGTSNGTGSSAYGVAMRDGGRVESEGTGDINITGFANNATASGLSVASSAVIERYKAGNVNLKAGNQATTSGNQIELSGGSIQGAIAHSNSGSILTLNPIDPTTGIAVGGNGSNLGAFNLSDSDLAAITEFDTVQIGDTAHTGSYTVGTLDTFSSTNQQLNLVSNTSTIAFIEPTSFGSSLFVNANSGAVEFNMTGTLNSTNKINVIAQDNINMLVDSEIIAGAQGAKFTSTSGDITLTSVTSSGDVTAVANGDITLESGAVITANNIKLAAQTGNFINNAVGNALVATNHWTVASQDPSQDSIGDLVYNYKQYNTTYDPATDTFSQTLLGTLNGAGNGFVYLIAPTLTPLLVSNSNSVNKVYNGNTNVEPGDITYDNFSGTGLVNGDDISGYIYSSASYDNKNVGSSKTVTITNLDLLLKDTNDVQVFGYGNQTGIAALSGAIGEITQADITAVTGITANNKATYDATTSATLNTGSAGFTGKIGTDVLTVATATGAFANKNVGTNKTVNITGITLGGTDAANYNLTNNTATTTANITSKANITAVTGITANNKTTYDATTTATLNSGSASFTGKIGSDVLSVGTATGAFADKNVGTNKMVNITGITLAGTDAANYNLTNNTATATADIVNKADLTVTATGVNKLFDSTTTAQIALADNRISGDSLTIINSTADFIDSDIGANKLINVSGISISGGTDAGNYNLLNTSATTFADIFDDNGVAATNLTEKTVVDSTSDLALVVIPVQLKVFNEDGTESLMTVDVPKGKVLSCK